jgi:Rieske Fe-S protein
VSLAAEGVMALSRRKLLVVGGGAVCAHVIGCGGSEPTVLPNEIPAGNKATVALDTLTPVSGAAVAIGRDSGGIYAMSLVCTHQGCNIAQSGGSVGFNLIRCGCHGSEFDGQGNVTHAPATQPLPHLAVTADMAGALTIHGDMPVSATVRLQV